MDRSKQEECRNKILDLVKSKGCSPYYEYFLRVYVEAEGCLDHGLNCVNYELFEGANLKNFIFNSASQVRTERY